MALVKPVLWIRIGSVFRNFVDPDQYAEYGSGPTQGKYWIN